MIRVHYLCRVVFILFLDLDIILPFFLWHFLYLLWHFLLLVYFLDLILLGRSCFVLLWIICYIYNYALLVVFYILLFLSLLPYDLMFLYFIVFRSLWFIAYNFFCTARSTAFANFRSSKLGCYLSVHAFARDIAASPSNENRGVHASEASASPFQRILYTSLALVLLSDFIRTRSLRPPDCTLSHMLLTWPTANQSLAVRVSGWLLIKNITSSALNLTDGLAQANWSIYLRHSPTSPWIFIVNAALPSRKCK